VYRYTLKQIWSDRFGNGSVDIEKRLINCVFESLLRFLAAQTRQAVLNAVLVADDVIDFLKN